MTNEHVPNQSEVSSLQEESARISDWLEQNEDEIERLAEEISVDVPEVPDSGSPEELEDARKKLEDILRAHEKFDALRVEKMSKLRRKMEILKRLQEIKEGR